MEPDEYRRWKTRKCIAIAALLEEFDETKTLTCIRRGKTRSWIKRRSEKGYFNNIVRELMVEDTAAYRDMMRMSYEDFTTILTAIEHYIIPQQVTRGGHKVIAPAERLTLTIRFLATGETYRSLCFQFRISVSAISYIVKQVCKAIYEHLGPEYLKVPETNEEWLDVAARFEEKWNYPNCLGAIDGKHIVMQPPPNAGSHYYNITRTPTPLC